MGRKPLLTDAERVSIVKYLAAKKTTLEIARLLGRDHRTVKNYTNNPDKKYTRPTGKYKTSTTTREATRLKRALSTNPLGTSKQVFEAAGIEIKSRSTRCRVLKTIGKNRKASPRPKLTSDHKQRRLDWAMNNMKMEFSKVIWTDESRVSLDGPDGWAR
ncbi:hypothetical protein FOL47_005548, partial [Perkinsus chesapeaki]